MRHGGFIARCIWAACLLIGGANHARALFRHGLFWDYGYGGIAWPSTVYWSSLTLLDPLVAALLFFRPRIGIPATILLIVTNVAHNLAVTARYAPDGEFLARAAHPITLSQIGFMLFVLATARIAWKGVEEGGHDPTAGHPVLIDNRSAIPPDPPLEGEVARRRRDGGVALDPRRPGRVESYPSTTGPRGPAVPLPLRGRIYGPSFPA